MDTYDASMSEPVAQITLPGAVVLVTGGSRGIGAGIARAFLAAGARVVVCGRTPPEAGTLPKHDGRAAQFIACDVRKPELVQALIDQVVREHGRLDVLVNNAGGTPSADLADSSPQLIERVIQLNLLAPLYCSQAANRVMQLQEEGGSIINIGSVAGLRPAPASVVYGAAKAGLLSATESLAMEWGPRVRVNAVVLGFVATENANEHYGGPEGIAPNRSHVPARRLAGPRTRPRRACSSRRRSRAT
jgi:NAD(P)-dependent dehydrogenase (short-subunit alcohol dehydrogenase family)